MKNAVKVLSLLVLIGLGICTAAYACPPVMTEYWYYATPELVDVVGWKIHTCCPGSTWYSWGEVTPYYEVFFDPCY